jgi:hypothetical protein
MVKLGARKKLDEPTTDNRTQVKRGGVLIGGALIPRFHHLGELQSKWL